MSFDDAERVDAAAIDARPLNCAVDDFTTLDMTRWFPYSNGPTLVTTGEVAITLPVSTDGYAGLDSVPFDFTSGHVTVEVPQVVGQPNVENYLLVFVDSANFYAIGYDANRMHYYRREAGTDLAKAETYDPVAHRHWRIGYDSAASEIYFSTSPNRVTWSERYRVPLTVPITNVKTELAAGSYAGGSATPGEAKFDNFQLCLP